MLTRNRDFARNLYSVYCGNRNSCQCINNIQLDLSASPFLLLLIVWLASMLRLTTMLATPKTRKF